MGKLNHKKIEDTKNITKGVIKRLDKSVDSFVDFLVQSKPELFTISETTVEGETMDPFVIIELLNKNLLHSRLHRFFHLW